MFRLSTTLISTTLVLITGAAQVRAHVAPWVKGIWECNDGSYNNNDLPAQPLYMRNKFGADGWWFHGDDCIKHRPSLDQYLEVPAGGNFTVEMSANRAFTTLSYNGAFTGIYPDGEDHPEGLGDGHTCIFSPKINLHAVNESDTAGYVFAIAYESDPYKVTLDSLVVFSVREHTPFRRVVVYDVPEDLPECPPGGCICAALWIPNHCGEPNEYMIGYNCKVTNVKPTARALAPAQTPVWCEGEPDKCVKGAKGMIVFNQLEGNNIDVNAFQMDGMWRSPGYNQKTGFKDGAQNDIFLPANATINAANAAANTTNTANTNTTNTTTNTAANTGNT